MRALPWVVEHAFTSEVTQFQPDCNLAHVVVNPRRHLVARPLPSRDLDRVQARKCSANRADVTRRDVFENMQRLTLLVPGPDSLILLWAPDVFTWFGTNLTPNLIHIKSNETTTLSTNCRHYKKIHLTNSNLEYFDWHTIKKSFGLKEDKTLIRK